jgi:hypothetical protein
MAADDLVAAQTARNIASPGELVSRTPVNFPDEVYAKTSAPSRTVPTARTARDLGLARAGMSLRPKTQLLAKEPTL